MTNNHFNTVSDFLNISLDSGDEVFSRFASLPRAIIGAGDKPLDRFVYIPGTRKDRVVLVAHADTVWDKEYDRTFSGEKKVEFANGVFFSSNPECGIGADDRAGCAMLWELSDIGHSILLVDGEENGKHGSKYLRESHPQIFKELNRHCFMLELDWRGTHLCLYNQVDNTDKFKKYISDSIGFEDDMKQGGCDLQILCKDICGVNLGVGYHRYHTPNETLVFDEWENTFFKLKDFLEKPQKRFKSKFFIKYVRFAKSLVYKIFKILKLKK